MIPESFGVVREKAIHSFVLAIRNESSMAGARRVISSNENTGKTILGILFAFTCQDCMKVSARENHS